MKKITFLLFLTISFISCEENETIDIEPETVKVIGEWQLYRSEKLESIIDQWTGTEWTYVDKWFKTVRQDSPIILEFKEDGTFLERYADVVVAEGTWLKINTNSYSFEYAEASKIANSNLPEKCNVTFYCENTFSFKNEGDHKSVFYYKTLNDIECASSITYYVND